MFKTVFRRSVRVQFELGHEASVRTKKTPEGFTHDWEVFVRGADNTDIQYFVDKVVFHLHETFPKPRRVIKEPPYLVKESGYAGFVIPIDVYLKNKEEPKKISFQYDLSLQPSGPPISRLLREPRLFQNPSEDFRRKLIRGGGVGVDTPSTDSHAEDLKSSSINAMSQNKSKATESPVKKHKTETPSNHSFAELFGPPIRRVVEPKKLPEVPKKKETPEAEKKKVNKHGTFRDEKDIVKEKEKYSEKERNKDKNKEKSSKRPPSPPPPLPQVKPKEDHKKHEEKEKKKEDYEEKKKRKEEKEKKEKVKDVEKQDHKKEKKDVKDIDYLKKIITPKPPEPKPVLEKVVTDSAEKERPEKEKHKHRHKKKEKEKNRDKEKHRKEKEKDSKERSKEKEVSIKKRHDDSREREEKMKKKSKSPSPVLEKVKKGPLNALLDELGSSDSASPLSEEEPMPSFKTFSKPPAKVVPETKLQPVNVAPKLKSTNLNTPPEPKPEELNIVKAKKEKSSSKKSKKSDKDPEKKKIKEERRTRSPSTEKEEEEVEKEKVFKEDRIEDERSKVKDKENRKRKREKSEEKQVKKKAKVESVPVEIPEVTEEPRRPDKFTKEYIAQLKDLQHRIMSLEDNAELRKVVKVIEETGQYEITKKTFDFDLCALDFETVKRLQEFFAPT